MIATVHIADIGRSSTLRSLRRHPDASTIAGLRWLDVAVAVPLASTRPPGLRRALMLAFWDDEAAAADFADNHPAAAPFEAAQGYHAVLRPLRAFGTWPGLPPDTPRTRTTPHDGRVAVFTLGRLRLTQTVRFLRASRPAERAAIGADGFVWGTAAAYPPFVATFSVWDGPEAAAAYAYGSPDAGHPRAITAQRRKDFHHQSAFVRFGIIDERGALPTGR